MFEYPSQIDIEAAPSMKLFSLVTTEDIDGFTSLANAANNLLMPFSYFQQSCNQMKSRQEDDTVSKSDKEDELRAEIAALKQELKTVKQQKANIENSLANSIVQYLKIEAELQKENIERKLEEEAFRRQVQEMQIEIDLNKLGHQVAEITKTEYFQKLQQEIELLRDSK